MSGFAPQDRLIVALDVPSVSEARQLVADIGDAANFYKVGMELVFAGGLALVAELRERGHHVFLDMKLLDIGNTVERAVAQVAVLGASFLTIHGIDRKTVAAAARGRGSSSLKLLSVTVMTSLDEADLAEQHIQTPLADLVEHRANLAIGAGADGIVASALEAKRIRAAVGPDAFIVTPGIRLAEDDAGDQARVATPRSAIADGATHLVVGRPINQASDPRAAALRFQAEISAAIAGR